jgi:hypothetical protein
VAVCCSRTVLYQCDWMRRTKTVGSHFNYVMSYRVHAVKVWLHGAIFSATCLVMALRHKLHGTFLLLTGCAFRNSLRDKLQQSLPKVEFASTFGQRLLQLVSALHRVDTSATCVATPLLDKRRENCTVYQHLVKSVLYVSTQLNSQLKFILHICFTIRYVTKKKSYIITFT